MVRTVSVSSTVRYDAAALPGSKGHPELVPAPHLDGTSVGARLGSAERQHDWGKRLPTIDTPLLLDLLLGLVILLFAPFGIRRGAAKEAMVAAGLLFGALVATTWAERGGTELATRFGVDARVAPFAVAMAALVGGMFVIGYGGGAALGRVPQGWTSHLVGGLLGILNGGLFVTYLLTFLEAYLQLPRALEAGMVAETLLERFDLIQLAVGAGLILLVILGIIVNNVRQQSQPRPSVVAPSRLRPVRVASGGDAGKFEPEAVSIAGGERLPPTLEQTTPMLERPPRPWDGPSRGDNGRYQSWATTTSANGQPAQPDADNIWERRPSAASWGAGGGAMTGGAAGYGAGSSAEPSGSRCPSCGASIGPRDLFCPSCGKTV